MSPRRLWILITAAGVIPAAAIGYWLTPTPPEPVTAPVQPVVVEPGEPDPEFPLLHRGPRPPGVWAWSELRGGECVEPFESAWANEFVVVECTSDHQAEFGRVVIIDTDPAAPYPGEETLAETASQHCQRWERDELVNPEAFDDLIAEPAYSVGEDAWDRGDRLLGCFVSQKDGERFSEKLLN